MRNKLRIHVSGAGCVFLAVALLILPLKWLAAAMCACVIHELSHIVAIRLCGGEIRGICVGAQGASIQIGELSMFKELVCALAGPLGSLCLLPFVRWMPRVALCATVHSLYNLLPIYPLDGGRALSCAAAMLLPPDQAQRLCNGIQFGCVSICAAVCILGSAWMGIAPLILLLLLLIRSGVVKFACKPRPQRLQ